MAKQDNSSNIFESALVFVRANMTIVYTLLLLAAIPVAFFANNYLANYSYEKAIDKITQRKAALAENIINILLNDQASNDAMVQSTLDRIARENGEIVLISVLKPVSGQGNFKVVASSDVSSVGREKSEEIQNLLAWSKSEGIAFIDRDARGRYWSVTRALVDAYGNKYGLVEMSLSLEDSDALISKVISDSYWILFLTVLVIVLMVANQARLLGYASTVNKLKEIDKMKDMFISMASHELRTPLTAIKGYLDLLQGKLGADMDTESRRYMDNIASSSHRLEGLVSDILEVSRIEGNRLPMEIETIDPDPVISGSVEELRSQAIQKNLALDYKPSGAPARVRADAGRLKQVMVNFIGNALKYTQKGSVQVTSAVKNGDYLVTVADTGIGMSSEDQANLFQKFYRIKNEQTKNIVGTGLGLWITLEIAKRMGGRISVESIEGVGTHFTLRLPLAKE